LRRRRSSLRTFAFNLVAGTDGGEPRPTRVADAIAVTRRKEMLQHPLAAIRAALDPSSTVSNLRTEDDQAHVDVVTSVGDAFTIGFEPETKRPSHVTYRAYDAAWGDIVVESTFSSYQDAGGLQVPGRIVTKQDQWTMADVQIARTTVDADVGDLAAPDAVRSARVEAPPVTVTAEQVARGIWWLAGGSHHTVVFEFADHLTMFEAPLGDARTLAVIAKARTLVPGKPLTHAIVSHHHLDHAGGFRAAVSEGLTIITQRGNEAFLRHVASRAHTLGQDALAKSPKAPMFEFVDDTLTLQDAALELQIFKTIPNSHTGHLLYAWVPRDGMLVEADFYDVSWPRQPWGDNLLANVAARKLRVLRHVPIHGTLQTWPEVLQVLATAPGPALRLSPRPCSRRRQTTHPRHLRASRHRKATCLHQLHPPEDVTT
jgi:glyoxylase-like metal-dependent hydrolase (beta-lactamase superfamily II)